MTDPTPPSLTKTRRKNPALALLRKHGACEDATEWVRTQRGKTPQQIWDACERGDWPLWLAAKVVVDRRIVVTAACRCARLALKHVPAGETRPLKAIETAEAWTRGEATISQVRADAAAYAAAYAAALAAEPAPAADAAPAKQPDAGLLTTAIVELIEANTLPNDRATRDGLRFGVRAIVDNHLASPTPPAGTGDPAAADAAAQVASLTTSQTLANLRKVAEWGDGGTRLSLDECRALLGLIDHLAARPATPAGDAPTETTNLPKGETPCASSATTRESSESSTTITRSTSTPTSTGTKPVPNVPVAPPSPSEDGPSPAARTARSASSPAPAATPVSSCSPSTGTSESGGLSDAPPAGDAGTAPAAEAQATEPTLDDILDRGVPAPAQRQAAGETEKCLWCGRLPEDHEGPNRTCVYVAPPPAPAGSAEQEVERG